MAERIVIGYKRLFEVRLLHHYWLDDGSTGFDLLAEPARNKRLLTYDVRPFLEISATTATEKRLAGLRCKFKATALGFIVAAPKDVRIPSDAYFEFGLKVTNADFFNYTALTLRKQSIYELYDQSQDKIFRSKENVFVFSNDGGVEKLTAGTNILFLSKSFPSFEPAKSYKAESFVGLGGQLYQATADLDATPTPGAGWQEITSPANHPIYVNQGDIPTVTPPIGLTGVPERGIELTEDIPDDIFALIRIKTLAPSSHFSLLSASNQAPPAPSKLREPVFEIRFKNRITNWKYFKKTTQTPIPNSGGFFPLTYFGNAYSPPIPPAPNFDKRVKPSISSIQVDFDTSNPPKITRLVSEIFV